MFLITASSVNHLCFLMLLRVVNMTGYHEPLSMNFPIVYWINIFLSFVIVLHEFLIIKFNPKYRDAYALAVTLHCHLCSLEKRGLLQPMVCCLLQMSLHHMLLHQYQHCSLTIMDTDLLVRL